MDIKKKLYKQNPTYAAQVLQQETAQWHVDQIKASIFFQKRVKDDNVH